MADGSPAGRRASVSFRDSQPEAIRTSMSSTNLSSTGSPILATSGEIPKGLRTGGPRAKNVVVEERDEELVSVSGSLFDNSGEVQKSELRKRLEIENASSSNKLRNKLRSDTINQSMPSLLQRRGSVDLRQSQQVSVSPSGNGGNVNRELINTNFKTNVPLIKPTSGMPDSPTSVVAKKPMKAREVPMAWKEFMTYILVFLVLATALVVPVSTWVAYTFLYGELVTLNDSFMINRAISVTSQGKIGINVPNPSATVEIKNIDNMPSIFRLSNFGSEVSNQRIEFGAYRTSGTFVPGVTLSHTLDKTESQLLVSGGQLVVGRDMIVSGSVAVRGALNIAKPSSTVTVNAGGFVETSGEFLTLLNDEGAFRVQRENENGTFSLFSIAADGSFSVDGQFEASSLIANGGLFGSMLTINQVTEQTSRIYNPDGNAIFSIRTGAGFEATVNWYSGKQFYAMGIAGDGKLGIKDSGNPIFLYDPTGQLSFQSEIINFYNLAGISTNIVSKIGTAALTVASGSGHSAAIHFRVIEDEYSMIHDSKNDFAIRRKGVDLFKLTSDNRVTMNTQTLEFVNSADSLYTNLYSSVGDAMMYIGTNASTTDRSAAILRLSHAATVASSNFTLANTGNGIFTISTQSYDLLKINAPQLSARMDVKSLIVTSSTAQSSKIFSNSSSVNLALQASVGTAQLAMTVGTRTFSLQHGPEFNKFKTVYTDATGSTDAMIISDTSELAVYQRLTTVEGNMTVNGKSTFTGETIILNGEKGILFGQEGQSGTRLWQSTDFGKTLNVGDNFVIEKGFAVKGSASFVGNVTVAGDLTMETIGKKVAFGDSVNLYRDAASATLITDAAFHVNQSLSVQSTATVGGSVTVANNIYLADSSARLLFSHPTKNVELSAPIANTLQTPNDVTIEGSLYVGRDMSVDGIIFAAVNVNPGYLRISVGLPAAMPAGYAISGRPKVALGKDGKPFIPYSFTFNGQSYIGIVHCFDTGCATTRKYYTLSDATNPLSITPGSDPTPVLFIDGLMRVVFVDSAAAGGPGVRVGHCTESSCKSFKAVSNRVITEAVGAVISDLQATVTSRGTLLIVYRITTTLTIVECTDADLQCATVATPTTVTGLDAAADGVSTAIVADGSVITVFRKNSKLTALSCPPSSIACATGQVSTEIEAGGLRPSVSISRNGFPLIVHTTDANALRIVPCQSMTCSTSGTGLTGNTPGYHGVVRFGGDGFGAIAFRESYTSIKFLHCNDASCSQAYTQQVDLLSGGPTYLDEIDMVIGSDLLPLVIGRTSTAGVVDIKITHCSNPFCTPFVRR